MSFVRRRIALLKIRRCPCLRVSSHDPRRQETFSCPRRRDCFQQKTTQSHHTPTIMKAMFLEVVRRPHIRLNVSRVDNDIIPDILNNETNALQSYPPAMLERIWQSMFVVMEYILEVKGNNACQLPHVG